MTELILNVNHSLYRELLKMAEGNDMNIHKYIRTVLQNHVK